MNAREADELIRAYKKEKDVRTSRRIHAVALVRVKGFDVATAAEYTLQDPEWVRMWVGRYEEEGLDGLSDRPRSGRPPREDPDRIGRVIREACDAGTTSVGVRSELRERLGVTYSIEHVRTLMR